LIYGLSRLKGDHIHWRALLVFPRLDDIPWLFREHVQGEGRGLIQNKDLAIHPAAPAAVWAEAIYRSIDAFIISPIQTPGSINANLPHQRQVMGKTFLHISS